jgi:hypothetical protein
MLQRSGEGGLPVLVQGPVAAELRGMKPANLGAREEY